jgi:hypothetical protein
MFARLKSLKSTDMIRFASRLREAYDKKAAEFAARVENQGFAYVLGWEGESLLLKEMVWRQSLDLVEVAYASESEEQFQTLAAKYIQRRTDRILSGNLLRTNQPLQHLAEVAEVKAFAECSDELERFHSDLECALLQEQAIAEAGGEEAYAEKQKLVQQIARFKRCLRYDARGKDLLRANRMLGIKGGSNKDDILLNAWAWMGEDLERMKEYLACLNTSAGSTWIFFH